MVAYLCTKFKQLGLDIDARDNFGYSAVILTCIHTSETDSLISHGGKATPAESPLGKGSKTPVFAEAKLRKSILEVLTKHGSKWIERSYKKTYNPLHWAIINGTCCWLPTSSRSDPSSVTSSNQ